MCLGRVELENLLIEDDELDGYDIFVWGTGNTSMLYQEGLRRLAEEGVVVDGYIDNNQEKWGKFFNQKKVYSPEEIKGNKNILVLISSPQPNVIKEISSQLKKLGLKWRHIDDFIFKKHKNEVMACYDLLSDEKSKRVYKELVECRIGGKYPNEEIIDTEQYFSFGVFANSDPNEVFVDCGAYVGDTIEKYIWKKDGVFRRIIAFEPDFKNVSAMKYRVERLKKEWNIDDEKIIVYPFGVSDESRLQYISRYENNNGLGSKLVQDEDGDECKVVALDDVIQEKIDFLKADIESYEYKMLLGAQRCISKWKPKMAICIYHNAVDFYSIPLLLHKINPSYEMKIRHYTHSLSDSVLYVY